MAKGDRPRPATPASGARVGAEAYEAPVTLSRRVRTIMRIAPRRGWRAAIRTRRDGFATRVGNARFTRAEAGVETLRAPNRAAQRPSRDCGPSTDCVLKTIAETSTEIVVIPARVLVRTPRRSPGAVYWLLQASPRTRAMVGGATGSWSPR
jgi:hypothetical protein